MFSYGNDENRNLSKYDDMSAEQLQKLLNSDFYALDAKLSAEEIIYLSNLLAQREETEKSETVPDTAKMWQRFKEDYVETGANKQPALPKHRHISRENSRRLKRKYLKRLLLAAIIAAFIAALAVTATSYRDLWDVFPEEKKGIFKFKNYDQEFIQYNNDELMEKHAPRFSDLNLAVELLGIDEQIIPTWLPKGFEPALIEIHRSEFITSVYSKYRNGDNYLSIDIGSQFFGTSPNFEVDEGSATEYVSNGKTHYLATNEGRNVAFWTSGPFYVELAGDVTQDDLCKMIDSVYKSPKK